MRYKYLSHDCFVYGLTDPRTEMVRYIGRTVSGLSRPKSHASPRRLAKDHTHKANWIRQLQSLGLVYGVVVLEEAPKEKLGEVEVRWVAKARTAKWPLTNLTDGGEGGHSGRVLTREHRECIATALKGKVKTWEAGKKKVPVVETTTGQKFQSIGDAARAFGVTKTRILDVMNGKFSQTRGLRFAFLSS